MRDHRTIIRAFGATKLKEALAGVGVFLSPSTPNRWVDRNRIPGEYWKALADLGVATLDELACAVSAANDDTATEKAA